MINKYRKKPVVIEAELIEAGKVGELMFAAICNVGALIDEDGDFEIWTLEGVMKGNVGDYLIRGINGEFYPCKADIFHKSYELVVL